MEALFGFCLKRKKKFNDKSFGKNVRIKAAKKGTLEETAQSLRLRNADIENQSLLDDVCANNRSNIAKDIKNIPNILEKDKEDLQEILTRSSTTDAIIIVNDITSIMKDQKNPLNKRRQEVREKLSQHPVLAHKYLKKRIDKTKSHILSHINKINLLDLMRRAPIEPTDTSDIIKDKDKIITGVKNFLDAIESKDFYPKEHWKRKSTVSQMLKGIKKLTAEKSDKFLKELSDQQPEKIKAFIIKKAWQDNVPFDKGPDLKEDDAPSEGGIGVGLAKMAGGRGNLLKPSYTKADDRDTSDKTSKNPERPSLLARDSQQGSFLPSDVIPEESKDRDEGTSPFPPPSSESSLGNYEEKQEEDVPIKKVKFAANPVTETFEIPHRKDIEAAEAEEAEEAEEAGNNQKAPQDPSFIDDPEIPKYKRFYPSKEVKDNKISNGIETPEKGPAIKQKLQQAQDYVRAYARAKIKLEIAEKSDDVEVHATAKMHRDLMDKIIKDINTDLEMTKEVFLSHFEKYEKKVDQGFKEYGATINNMMDDGFSEKACKQYTAAFFEHMRAKYGMRRGEVHHRHEKFIEQRRQEREKEK